MTAGGLVYAAQLAQVALGLVFLVSIWSKLRDPSEFSETVSAYRILPDILVRPFAGSLLVLEAFLAVALISGLWTEIALPLSSFVLALFLVASSVTIYRGRKVRCGCFGSADEIVGRVTVARQSILLAASLWALAGQVLASSTRSPWEGRPAEYIAVLLTAALAVLTGSWLMTLGPLLTFGRRLLRKRVGEL